MKCGFDSRWTYMKYDFDTVTDRRNTGSVKWDVRENELPMWVADMDFKTAPEILEAIQRRLDNGIFGYSTLPDEWALSYVHWWDKRHSFKTEAFWFSFCTGVIPIISCAIREFTEPWDNVLIQAPVYNAFYNIIRNCDRNVVESLLTYRSGEYSMDFEDLEAKLSDPETKMFVLCNPHNPVGRIWSKEDLQKVGELCKKHGVLVISDEIHCDITDPDILYTPFASVSECCLQNSITAMAPTKCFNIAGIQSAAAMTPNPDLRARIEKALYRNLANEPNAFAVAATVAAFEHGDLWLDEMRSYVYQNKLTVLEYVRKNIPGLYVVPSRATYLLWLDCSAFTSDSLSFAAEIRRKTGLFLSYGTQYGESGKQFLRFNIACPRTLLLDGLDRLRRALS